MSTPIRRPRLVREGRTMTAHQPQHRRFPLSLWGRLHQPPVVTAAALVSYLTLLAAGALTLWRPPITIESQIGPRVTLVWAGCAIVAGILGTISAPRGIWWLERVALIAVGTFLAVYASTLINLQISAPGSRFMQIGLCVIGAYFCVSRWDRTRGAALDPTRGLQVQAPTTH